MLSPTKLSSRNLCLAGKKSNTKLCVTLLIIVWQFVTWKTLIHWASIRVLWSCSQPNLSIHNLLSFMFILWIYLNKYKLSLQVILLLLRPVKLFRMKNIICYEKQPSKYDKMLCFYTLSLRAMHSDIRITLKPKRGWLPWWTICFSSCDRIYLGLSRLKRCFCVFKQVLQCGARLANFVSLQLHAFCVTSLIIV